MPVCHGNADDHCCHDGGGVCVYLEENTVEGRRWACGLRRELGSWDKVHESDRYKKSKVGKWFALNHPGFGCGDYPLANTKCETCGVSGG